MRKLLGYAVWSALTAPLAAWLVLTAWAGVVAPVYGLAVPAFWPVVAVLVAGDAAVFAVWEMAHNG